MVRVPVAPQKRPRHPLRSSKWKKVCGPSCAVEGIEPTNNEPELCPATCRDSGAGSVAGRSSSDGSRFVERMLTVIATCRQQKHNVLEYSQLVLQSALAKPQGPVPPAGKVISYRDW